MRANALQSTHRSASKLTELTTNEVSGLAGAVHFDVVGVYRGESLLVINYRNERGGLVNEVLAFDGGLVRAGHGTYLHP